MNKTLRLTARGLLMGIGLALAAMVAVTCFTGCTAAQLAQVETTLPTAIAAQGVVIRAAGGPIDLEAQQRLVVRGKSTQERRQLVKDFRAARSQRLAVTHTTVAAVAKASAALQADLTALDADLGRNDAQIDSQIAGLAVEGEPVTPAPSTAAPPAPSTAPSTPAGPAAPSTAPVT